MLLLRWRGKDNVASGRDDHQALVVKSRWEWIVVPQDTHCLDCHALGFQLFSASRCGVLFAPVKRASVRVHPKESAMPVLGNVLPAGFARVLPEVFAHHRVCDGLNHARIDATGVKTIW